MMSIIFLLIFKIKNRIKIIYSVFYNVIKKFQLKPAFSPTILLLKFVVWCYLYTYADISYADLIETKKTLLNGYNKTQFYLFIHDIDIFCKPDFYLHASHCIYFLQLKNGIIVKKIKR